jgi:Ca2+-binding EF-hand superfamily protein
VQKSPTRRENSPLRGCVWSVALSCVLLVAISSDGAMGQVAAEAKSTATPTLKPADADGDGKITRVEWTKFVQSFRELDADQDNAVDTTELAAAVGEPKLESLVLAPIDLAGGKVPRAAWLSLGGAFKRVDADRNGTLELAEFEAVVAAKKAAADQSKTFALRAGLWRGALVEGRGENPNAGRQIELLVVGNQIAGRDVGRKGDDANLGTGTFVASGKPDAGILDAQYSDGRICRGIFEMRGEALYWCVSNRGEDRPDRFITANGFWLMVLKRVPDAK